MLQQICKAVSHSEVNVNCYRPGASYSGDALVGMKRSGSQLGEIRVSEASREKGIERFPTSVGRT